jgi:hypothetical protein
MRASNWDLVSCKAQLLLGVVVLAGCLLGSCVSAFAGTGFVFVSSFAPAGGFGEPVGVAVDNSAGPAKGSVYVSDQENDVVDQFDAAGTSISKLTLPAGAAPRQLAVDASPGLLEGDTYVAGFGSGTVYRFTAGLGNKEELITGLERPTGVAVDAAGNIFVSTFAGSENEGKILEFNASGEPVNAEGVVDANNVVIEGLNAPQAVAVTGNGAELYVATLSGTVKYTPAGHVYSQTGEPLDAVSSSGVTIAASGDIYVAQDEFGLGEIEQYSASGVLLSRAGRLLLSQSIFAVAYSESHNLYVADNGEKLVDIFEEGATPEAPVTEAAVVKGLTATFNGTLAGGATGYYFEYAQGETCEANDSLKSAEVLASGGAAQAEVTGLQALTQYSFCLVATNKYGATRGGNIQITTGPVAPVVVSQAASKVGSGSASLLARINPENLAGSYYFDYGAVGGVQKSTPKLSFAGSTSAVAASAAVIGLETNAEYSFHLVAENIDGEVGEGPEEIFRTLALATTALPDGRAYEVITPAANHDADVHVPVALTAGESLGEGTHTQLPFQVAPDGNSVTYTADPTEGGLGHGGNGAGNQYLARRESGGGWRQWNIQPAGRNATFYQGFSRDLSVGILSSGGEAPPRLAPLASSAPGGGYPILYSCALSIAPCMTSEEQGGDSQNPYRALFGQPLNRNSREFGSQGYGGPGAGIVSRGEIEVVPVFAGSAGNSDFLFEANDALPLGGGALERELVEGVRREMANSENHDYLYDSVGGQLGLVDVLPGNGGVAGDATFGAAPFETSFAEFDPPDFSNVVSSDGSRVYWTDLRSGVVYVRVEGVSTEQVSAAAARYWTSADDGRYAFYGEGGGLYRFDGASGTREALTGVGAGSGLLGVVGTSDDGGEVYFVAEKVLGSGVSGEGVNAVAGEPNLYLARHGSEPVFIATLSSRDGSYVKPFDRSLNALVGEYGDWQPALGNRTAEVTGGGVVFMSERSLKSVGFGGGAPNGGDEEVYLFEAGSGRLVCVSCSPSGEAPPSQEGGAAAFLPISWSDTYLPQWVSADGSRVFFDSAVPLVAQDTNGKQDVYEWEREGSGSCTSAAAVNGGCVYLLSGGTSLDSWFIGASENGSDAFIVTRAQLVPEDQNDAFDLYDARVGGAIPPSAPACTGTGCQGVPGLAPTFATPPSLTFSGVGNFPPPTPVKPKPKPQPKGKPLTRAQKLSKALKACTREKNKRKREVCRARAHKRYGHISKRSGKRASRGGK